MRHEDHEATQQEATQIHDTYTPPPFIPAASSQSKLATLSFVEDINQRKALGTLAALVLFVAMVAAMLAVVDNGESTTLGSTETTEVAVAETTTTMTEGAASTSVGESGSVDPAGATTESTVDPEASGPNPGEQTAGTTSGNAGDGNGGGGGEPTTIEPTEPPLDPCAAALEAGRSLLVTPDPALLPNGTLSSELTIINCTSDNVDWTALTKPWVELANDSGSLSAGSSSPLAFSIQSGSIEPGAFEFKIKVSANGANQYVDVAGFRPTFGTDMVDPSLGLTAGPDAGGCNNSCISSALLTSNLTTPNVSLEMNTRVPAKMRVFVSTSAPTQSDGHPVFAGVTPIAINNTFATSWTALLEPLEPATKYHIIVKATDENGNSQWETSSFTTRTPAQGPSSLAGPGCELQCIIKALFTPTDDATVTNLEVATTVPASIEAFVSDAPFAYAENGVTPIVGGSPIATNGEAKDKNWTTTISDLDPATKYYVIIRATDGNGEVSLLDGSFTTAAASTHDVWITMERVTINHDGDPSWGNRGEIELGWGVGEDRVATIGEQKLSDGDVETFDPFARNYVLQNVAADTVLPLVRVWAIERDWDLWAEFSCSFDGVYNEPFHNKGCDRRGNVSELGGLYTRTTIDNLPRCSTCGFEGTKGDEACMQLTSVGGLGDQYVRFEAIVSYTVID